MSERGIPGPLTFAQYGNEPDIDIHYSRAAMLIRIPPFHERLSNAPAPKSIWEGVTRDPSYYDDDEEWDEEKEMSSMDDDDDEEYSDDEVDDEGDGAGPGNDEGMPDA